MNVLHVVKSWLERNTTYESPEVDQALIDAERYLAQLDMRLAHAERRVESRNEEDHGTKRNRV